MWAKTMFGAAIWTGVFTRLTEWRILSYQVRARSTIWDGIDNFFLYIHIFTLVGLIRLDFVGPQGSILPLFVQHQIGVYVLSAATQSNPCVTHQHYLCPRPLKVLQSNPIRQLNPDLFVRQQIRVCVLSAVTQSDPIHVPHINIIYA